MIWIMCENKQTCTASNRSLPGWLCCSEASEALADRGTCELPAKDTMKAIQETADDAKLAKINPIHPVSYSPFCFHKNSDRDDCNHKAPNIRSPETA